MEIDGLSLNDRGRFAFWGYEDMCMINGRVWEKRFGRENRNRLSFSYGVFLLFLSFFSFGF
jgi:hypothetical protein